MQRFTPGSIRYDRPAATNYVAGRALSLQSAATWRLTIQPFIPQTPDLTIVDLGSGTGRFSSLLAQWCDARVIGVEPSADMRMIAARDHGRMNVRFLAGTAECIPLRDRSCDVVWLSQVWHHVRDHRSCAKEIRRVLRAPGVVLIRGTFAESKEGFPTMLQFFPGIAPVFTDLPSVEHTIHTFESQGLKLDSHRRVQQQICASLREFAERTRLRADSSLVLLSDENFAACQAELEAAAAREDAAEPVVETLDFLVFR